VGLSKNFRTCFNEFYFFFSLVNNHD
jgi:hypothetical protein